jgi:hypothetical protein
MNRFSVLVNKLFVLLSAHTIDLFSVRIITKNPFHIGTFLHVIRVIPVEFGVVNFENFQLKNLLNLFTRDLFLIFVPRLLSKVQDSDDQLDELCFQVTVCDEVHAYRSDQGNGVDEILVNDGDIILYNEFKNLDHHDGIHKLLGLALRLEILEDVFSELVLLPRKALEVLMVTIDDALLKNNLDQVFVILFVLFATDGDHLVEESLEPLDVNLVICDETFVSDDFDEAAERSHSRLLLG